MFVKIVLIQCLLLSCINGYGLYNKTSKFDKYTVRVFGGYPFGDHNVVKPGEQLLVEISALRIKAAMLGIEVSDNAGKFGVIKFKTDYRTFEGDDGLEYYQWNVTLTVPENFGHIQWGWRNQKDIKPLKYRVIKLLLDLHSSTPVEIDFPIGSEIAMSANGANFLPENQEITAYCMGGGPGEILLDWLDSSGNPLIPDENIQISDTERNYPAIRYYKTLKLKVTHDMEAFGCRMMNSTLGIITKWWNFTVAYPPLSTLIREIFPLTDDPCGDQMYNFTCSVEAYNLEDVSIHSQ